MNRTPHTCTGPFLLPQALPPYSPLGPRALTCPLCSPPCSCTHNRVAGHGSSVSRCSRGARLHTRPQGGRTGRPRRPQAAHMSALAQGHRASPGGLCVAPPATQAFALPPLNPTSKTAPSAPQVLCARPQRGGNPSHHPPAQLTVTGTAEPTLQAAAAPILAPPGTPAAVGAPQAQGTLGCLRTAQGAALGSSEQAPTASGHTSQRQVGGAQALYRGGEMRNEVGGGARKRQKKRIKHILGVFQDHTPSSKLAALSGHSRWTLKWTPAGVNRILPVKHL